MEQNYRIQVYIRRKGETVLDGNEYKTEQFEDLDELLNEVHSFIDRTVEDDDEYVYRNEG